MAYTISSTVGSKTANSMITLAECEAYIDAGPWPTAAWDALTDDAKKFRIIVAAKYMVNRFRWRGVPMHVNQAMPFPRYYPPGKHLEGAWPFGTRYYAEAYGGFVVNDRFYAIPGWGEVIQYSDLTEEQLEELDVVPDDIKRAQAWISYDIVHRGLVGVTNPGAGTKVKPELKSLKVFDSIDITVATTAVQKQVLTGFDDVTQSEHFVISMLLEGYTTGLSWGVGTTVVSPLAEVD